MPTTNLLLSDTEKAALISLLDFAVKSAGLSNNAQVAHNAVVFFRRLNQPPKSNDTPEQSRPVVDSPAAG